MEREKGHFVLQFQFKRKNVSHTHEKKHIHTATSSSISKCKTAIKKKKTRSVDKGNNYATAGIPCKVEYPMSIVTEAELKLTNT